MIFSTYRSVSRKKAKELVSFAIYRVLWYDEASLDWSTFV